GPAGGVCRFCIVSVFCTIFRYMQNCLYTEYPLVFFVQFLDTVFIQFLKIVQKKHANCTKNTDTLFVQSIVQKTLIVQKTHFSDNLFSSVFYVFSINIFSLFFRYFLFFFFFFIFLFVLFFIYILFFCFLFINKNKKRIYIKKNAI